MVNIKIDAVQFRLKEYQDFSWLKNYGTVFCVFDQTGSGCISFGVDSGKKKYFVKIAGVKTVEAELTSTEAVTTLKNAMNIYEDLKHPSLIKIFEHYPLSEYYVAVFEWVEGECLFDHWNFEKYSNSPHIKSPALKFKELPIRKRLESVETLFSFLAAAADKDYVAVDFYDGSIIYDFDTDITTICDIDFFRKKPTINDIGEDFFGTKRLKAPEEYAYGSTIDEITNVYTLGALIFNVFGNYTDAEIRQRYDRNAFSPCSLVNWELNKQCYDSVLKSVALDRNKRYGSIADFRTAWDNALFVN